MGIFKALVSAGAVALGAQGAARAADFLPTPPPVMPYDPGTPEFSGWYLRGDVAANAYMLRRTDANFAFNVPDNRFEQQAIGGGASWDVGLGYQFNNWFRADVTGEYRTGTHMSSVESYNQGFFFNPKTADRSYDSYEAQISHIVLMANGYVDLGTWNNLTPYVGAGVGYAMHTVSGLKDIGGVSALGNGNFGGGGLGYAPTKTSGSLAWAVMAGLAYNVTNNVKLELGYRYMDLGTATSGAIVCQTQPIATCPFEVQKYKLASQDFRLGMRWMFDPADPGSRHVVMAQPAPVYQPQPTYQPPLVRKY